MGITNFIYLLLLISIGFLFYREDSNIKVLSTEEKPLLVFENSIAYNMSENGVTKVVDFKKTMIFKNYEKSFYSTIVSRDNKTSVTNILSADKILKENNKLFLNGNVHLLHNKDFNLETEELQYNLKTQIAKNSTLFILKKNDMFINGSNLYLDIKENSVKAKNIHFKIKLKD